MSFYVSEIKEGAPGQFVNSIQKKIYQGLESKGISYTRVESDPGITMEDCKNIDKAFGVDTAKTILLTNRQKNKFWLYLTHADRPFITKEFCAKLGIPRVSFADEELMQQLIGTTHGAATPLALIADSDHKICFVIDKDVAQRKRIVLTDGHACGFINIALVDIPFLTAHTPIIIE